MTEEPDVVRLVAATMWTYPSLETAVMVEKTDGDPIVARRGPETTLDG